MLDEKKLQEVERRVRQYMSDGLIRTKCKPQYVKFFLKNAEQSIDSAMALFELSTNSQKQESFGFTSFNGFLWVVNASYYSMFYMARALLEQHGIKTKTDVSVHTITFDVLVFFFYLTGKLQKAFLEEYLDARQDSAQLLGKQKAEALMEDYYFEKRKRASFTYDMGVVLVEAKARTSLQRAQRFQKEIMNLVRV